MPSFGNTDAGALLDNISGNCVGLRKAAFLRTAGVGETVTKLYVYGQAYEGVVTVDVGVYTVDGSGNLDAKAGQGTVTLSDSEDWASVVVNIPLTNGVTYALAIGNQSAESGGIGRSTGDSGDGCYRGVQALPDPFGSAANTVYRYSAYADYTVTPAGGPFPHHARRAMEGSMIGMG